MPSNALGSRSANSVGTSGHGSRSFQAMFRGKLDAPSSDAQKATASLDATAQSQIAALLQSGMPLTTLVDRLAALVASAVPDASKNGSDLRSGLQTAIAQALHPPGNAPPGTAAEQAAALATRLRQCIVGVARDANDAGQQNELSGNILDAKSAKDTPAQAQGSQSKSTAVDADALARSLVAQVAATLQPASPSLAPADGAQPAQTPVAQTPDASPSTPANAPDLLARMLVRAASVDVRLNGNAPATPVADGAVPTTAAFAAKFAAALQTVVAQAASHEERGAWNPFDRAVDDRSTVVARTQDPQIAVGTAPTFSNAVQHAQTMPVATSAPVDANAVVEQLVKSMAMRTGTDGTSQIRLHLSPAHLGDLSMKITVQGGTISASVVAQNGDVRNALMNNQHHLARSLADAGLSLAGFSVDVSGGDAGSRQNRDRATGFGRRYVVHELGGASETEGDQSTISSLGPSILSNTSLALFNYLA